MAALYSAADVMVVTPLRDGMNLVAKEYVASRPDLGGALVLSEFAGAAEELDGAFLVNPHDIAGLKRTILDAMAADHDDLSKRMSSMRHQVETHDVDAWADAFLEELGAEPEQSARERVSALGSTIGSLMSRWRESRPARGSDDVEARD